MSTFIDSEIQLFNEHYNLDGNVKVLVAQW
jgi:hypothetical protein